MDNIKLFDHQTLSNSPIPALNYYTWVEEALKMKGSALLPPKISIHPTDDIFYNTMPCVIPGSNIAGVKLVNRYPGRAPALDSHLLLYDYGTGHLKAIFDANYITAMRTGAVAVHSIATLANQDFKSVALMGLGNTGRATLKILCEKYRDKKFTIKLLKHHQQEDDIHRLFGHYKNITFVDVDSYQEAIIDSDIVISCITYTAENLAPDSCYKTGCTVIPVHTRGFQNCDLFFDKVYADDRGHVAGFKYFEKFKQFGEVADVINGKTSGRDSHDQRILVYNIGIALHDIFVAEKLFEELNTEQTANFAIPQEKFWVK